MRARTCFRSAWSVFISAASRAASAFALAASATAGLSLTAQPRHQLDGLLNAFFQTAE